MDIQAFVEKYKIADPHMLNDLDDMHDNAYQQGYSACATDASKKMQFLSLHAIVDKARGYEKE